MVFIWFGCASDQGCERLVTKGKLRHAATCWINSQSWLGFTKATSFFSTEIELLIDFDTGKILKMILSNSLQVCHQERVRISLSLKNPLSLDEIVTFKGSWDAVIGRL